MAVDNAMYGQEHMRSEGLTGKFGDLSPKKVMQAAEFGRKRMSNFKAARLMFIRAFTGQYYDQDMGDIGAEPLHLIFNAVRTIVPHIVMTFPKHTLRTPYLVVRDYAELLALALNQHNIKYDIKGLYRSVIVDAIFAAVGIIKTGLAESDSVYVFDEYDRVDGGTIYSERVDFDNWVPDPASREHLWKDGRMMGDTIIVPRQCLLDSGQYRNDLVERLPSVGDERSKDRVMELSMQGINFDDAFDLTDMVEVTELWIPSEQAVVTIPGASEVEFDDYLRVDDAYCVKEGPYTLLSLTPPVPGNPVPVNTAAVMYDLHTLGNRMAKKMIEQAMAQKDVIGYRRSAADDAEMIRDADNLELIAMDDPANLNQISLGGQHPSNESFMVTLSNWFNMMAGNPEQMSGSRSDAGSATEAKILAGNANVGLDDMKDAVYAMAGAEGRRRAWFLHTDPLINLPLVKRVQKAPTIVPTPMGPVTVAPSMMVEEQVFLTPEARTGDFFDFVFEVEPESMGRKDSSTRFAQAMDFMVQALPAVATAAQTMMLLGLPFSAKDALIRLAKDAGIDWFGDTFHDPEFQMMLAQQMMMGPQMGPSKGQLMQQNPMQGPGGMGAIMQNGQPTNVAGAAMTPQQEMNSTFQEGANEGQRQVKKGY